MMFRDHEAIYRRLAVSYIAWRVWALLWCCFDGHGWEDRIVNGFVNKVNHFARRWGSS